jgi:hypothetical protein
VTGALGKKIDRDLKFAESVIEADWAPRKGDETGCRVEDLGGVDDLNLAQSAPDSRAASISSFARAISPPWAVPISAMTRGGPPGE